MAIVVNRQIAGDLNNPTAELLNYCINEHKKQIGRLERLSNYYDGKHEINNRKKDNEAAPNNKVLINHAKYVVDMNVGFAVGNPISYVPANDKNIDPILDAYDRIDIVSHDTELAKDLSVFGVGYELIYLKKAKNNPSPELEIKCIDPRGIFLVTDDTVDKNSLFAVHYQPVFSLQGAIDHYVVKYYNDNRVITYHCKDCGMGEYKRENAKLHYFKEVPIVEYRNNEEKQGDFEQALSLIDAYNLLQSDRLNDKEAFVDAILFLKGFLLQDGDGEKLMKEKLLQTNALDVDATYLTKELNEDGVNLLRASILDDIHKITYVPNMNDEQFAGNVSGEAMKYKLFGLLQLMSVKSRYMIKGLRQRMKLFENILKVSDSSVDATGVKIKLKPNLPANTNDLINQIVDAHNAKILPLKTLLSWLPEIDDVDEVLQQLELEKEHAILLNQKIIGVQASDSHSDLDDQPADDIQED